MLLAFVLSGPSSAFAGGETKHVLVLSSGERPLAPQSTFADALMRELIRSSQNPIEFVEVPIQAARASGEAPGASIAQKIRSALGAGKLDLVMTIGGPAATFAQQFRQELFSATPTLFAGVDHRFIENSTLTDLETAVSTQHEPALVIDEILRLLPGTRSVMVVIGTSQVEQFWLQRMKHEFARFGGRLQFSWTNGLSFDEIAERCRTMPGGSAIFFGLLSLDGKGEPRGEREAFSALRAVATAPMFGVHGMGEGIVGGPMLSREELSRTTAQVALRVLAGEPPGSIKTPVQRTGRQVYDARELRRWKIDESRLPHGSVVLFREPTTWERNRRPLTFGVLLGGIPIAIVLLIGAIKQRRARSTRPVDAGQAGLSHLSRHLIQSREQERAALAKTLQDDVCQRMMALTLRLHTLDGIAQNGEVADIREKLASLVEELSAMSDPVYERLELLGLTSASRGFCEDLSARHDVAIHFEAEDVPGDLPSDIALVLFRVLQEAAINAVVQSEAREVEVSMRATKDEVRLQIVDRGLGCEAERTVPGSGVELLAIRERLNLVNGHCVIASTPGEGTRVEAWVPLRQHP